MKLNKDEKYFLIRYLEENTTLDKTEISTDILGYKNKYSASTHVSRYSSELEDKYQDLKQNDFNRLVELIKYNLSDKELISHFRKLALEETKQDFRKSSDKTKSEIDKGLVNNDKDLVKSDKINYSEYVEKLEEHKDEIPYSDVILNRVEGRKKRDRSLVQAIFSSINLMKEKGLM